MIGWKEDNNTVGPIAFAAKQSLLRLIPHILPIDSDSDTTQQQQQQQQQIPYSLYRLVLDHGDFGIHNISVATDADHNPTVTSLYDWETGCIVPALLSDPLMAVVGADLTAGRDAEPFPRPVFIFITTDQKHEQYLEWTQEYLKLYLLFFCFLHRQSFIR
jgi:hypothetical protein